MKDIKQKAIDYWESKQIHYPAQHYWDNEFTVNKLQVGKKTFIKCFMIGYQMAVEDLNVENKTRGSDEGKTNII